MVMLPTACSNGSGGITRTIVVAASVVILMVLLGHSCNRSGPELWLWTLQYHPSYGTMYSTCKEDVCLTENNLILLDPYYKQFSMHI